MIHRIHHLAIICSDYQRSKQWYLETLQLSLIQEHYRTERQSWKADLGLNEHYIIELFSFPNPPARVSRPEACGLRHLAFEVLDLDAEINRLQSLNVQAEEVRVDEFTGKRFTFIADPDGLPIELYEA